MDEIKKILLSLNSEIASEETRKIFGISLLENDLISHSAKLGGEELQLTLTKSIEEIKPEVLKLENAKFAINQSNLTIEKLYEKHSTRAKWIFVLSIVLLLVSVSILFFGLWMIFSNSSGSIDFGGVVVSLLGAVFGILDKFLFNIYKLESEKAGAVEKDIRLLQTVERQLTLVNVIDNDDVKNEAYLKIIESIN